MKKLTLISIVFCLILVNCVSATLTLKLSTLNYTAGTSSWTVTSGVTFMNVHAWGGGGAGGGRTSSGGAGGGGGGAFAEKDILITAGTVQNVTVGAVVVGGTGDGGNGNPSYLNTGAVVYAASGSGGKSAGTAGAGGTIAGSKGDIRYTGGNGAAAVGASSGGGGGGAGTTGVGGNASGITGGTGKTLFGGNGGAGVTTANNGNPGYSYGGGGSGASTVFGSKNGGNGAAGYMQIIYGDSGPYWTNLLISPVIKLGSALYYDINASDNTGISKYWVNDTTNFKIDATTGVLQNNTGLVSKTYYLTVYVNDTYNNLLTTDYFRVRVIVPDSLPYEYSWTDLSTTDAGNWVGSYGVMAVAVNPNNGLVYTGGGTTTTSQVFGVYNRTSNVWTDLRTTDAGNWAGTKSVYGVAINPATNIVYTVMGGGLFGSYNPTTNVWTDLSATDAGDWVSTSQGYSVAVHPNGLVYTGLASGKFGVYNATSNIWTSLSATDTGGWATLNLLSIVVNRNNGLVYTGIATDATKHTFGVYNATSNVWTDLSTTDAGDWVGSMGVQSIAVSPSSNIVYTGLQGGFGSYNPSTNVWTDLSATDAGDWAFNCLVYGIAVNEMDNLVYTAINVGRFGVYNKTSNVWKYLGATDYSGWAGSNHLYSISSGDFNDNNKNLVYTGLISGSFGVLNWSNANPTWVQTPSSISVYDNVALNYDINATDNSAVSSYWINDTINFNMNSISGMLQNKTGLSVKTYGLTVYVNDTVNNIVSAKMNVTVLAPDISPPTWNETPANRLIGYLSNLNYDLNASDPSGISQYWINDTINFNMNKTSGLLQNKTLLSIGVKYLTLYVNDTLNHVLSTGINVTVFDSIPPVWNETPTGNFVEYSYGFSYDINATDNVAIDKYDINDTVHFSIDSATGLILNKTKLAIGIYWINISVNDTYNNIISTVVNVSVRDTTLPSWIQIPTNKMIELGNSLFYDVNATDESGIIWSVNDTVFFKMDASYGILENNTLLPLGIKYVNITVADTSGNLLSAVISVTINPVPVLPVGNSQIRDIFEESGAGFGIFIQNLGPPLFYFFMIIIVIGVFAVIVSSLAVVIRIKK